MGQPKHHVVVLTLERHRDGSWITRLVEAIRQQDGECVITVLPVESVLGDEDVISSVPVPETATVLFNRVSDAADPILVKACMAILGLIYGDIPVVNGAAAYALCTSKWCHHMLFHRAGLSTPRTKKFFRPDAAKIQLAMEVWDDPAVEHFLLKPNAGGFGAGIVKCKRGASISAVAARIPRLVPRRARLVWSSPKRSYIAKWMCCFQQRA
jgi:hypothetical protein